MEKEKVKEKSGQESGSNNWFGLAALNFHAAITQFAFCQYNAIDTMQLNQNFFIQTLKQRLGKVQVSIPQRTIQLKT